MSNDQQTIAIVGIESWLGQHMLEVLSASEVPLKSVVPLMASDAEVFIGSWMETPIYGQNLEGFDFSEVDGVIFAAGSAISKQYAPNAVEAGAWVIDLSSAFHEVEAVPMVLSSVNGDAYFNEGEKPKMVTGPSCMSLALCLLLDKLSNVGPLHRVEVATYQSASGLGQKGVDALVQQSAKVLNGQAADDPDEIPKAFNVLPIIDQALSHGYSREEERIYKECKRVLGDDRLVVNATAVRVPVFYGHGAAVHVFFARPLETSDLDTLKKQSGLHLVSDPLQASAVACTQSDPAVRIGRLRQDWVDPCGLHLWLMCDNVHRGVAWNAVQLVMRYIV